ncbi:MAG TPA: hypothetical protein VM553_21065, partial [Dongiaceae bacterium]|nr:hypothetical protein [Dongiaceae bacterium]
MKRSTRVFWLMLTLWLAACAQQPPLPPLNLAEPLPAVGAQFETERRYVADHDHEAHHVQADSDVARSEWLFWRQDARVEMLIPARQAGEAWLRDGNAVFHQKLFHADHKIVEYQDADLDALQVSVNWNARVLLLDPQVLQQLQVKDEYWQDGQPLRELAGTVAGIQYEV